MSIAEAGRSRIRDGLIRLIAGDRSWGWLDVWPSRYGFTHRRLVVCPPGTSPTERALLRLWRTWPTIAVATGGLLLLISDAVGLPPDAVGAIAAAGTAAALLALAHATRRQRPTVRTRFGGTDDIHGTRTPVGDMELIERCWTGLTWADDALRAKTISGAEHELIWSRVWNELAPRPPRLHAPSAATRVRLHR